ncbi:hypothetical protein LRP52_45050 [Photobacterium sp. ZSDE20]|uniref:Uncharacterized protein n=1 Tax=Photobacterium pectinilyticum TaxID=2906793 RepID=A0ABT1N8Q6_9GAMM|nr:hypothetical protein [Photobacterium sp. ZSDE20]MCQ1061145.1 hypothetical protein [Photobacterium sp. ZSDE20]MDD1829336.1 hypothetical protein [Photobacterium sp. ZSDE20]
MDQAEGLRSIFQRQQCIQQVRRYHRQIREAVAHGKTQKVSQLLHLLETAQLQLEATYDQPSRFVH